MLDIIDSIYNNTVKDMQIKMASDIIKKQEERYRHMFDYHKDLLKIRHDQKNYLLGLIECNWKQEI